MLEYLDIPGFVMDSKYNYFQKVIAPATKRPKLEHPTDPQGKLYLLFLGFRPLSFSPTYLCQFLIVPTRQMREYKGCSTEALVMASNIANGTPIEPSRIALQAHIADLEADLRNVDFRLQNFFHQRTVISGILEDAVLRLKTEHS